MALLNFYNLNQKEKLRIFQHIANVKGLPANAVEKDWWVVLTLSLIFEMDIAPHLVFKGGTSLSKAWNLIQRFSEDIDLALDRNFLGFNGELSKKQVKKLKKESNKYISQSFYPALTNTFMESGYSDVEVKLIQAEFSDQDPLLIEVHYPAVTSQTEYTKPRVLVEIGSRSLREPFTIKEIVSFVGEIFPDRPFADTVINIPVVNPERTFLEKLFLLHEEFQKPLEKIKVDRLSRHLYDLEKLKASGYADKALANPQLFIDIVSHRKKITPVWGIDYANHHPASINPVPPPEVLKEWEKDYKIMCEEMIYGDTLSFSDLINRITELMNKINQLDFPLET